MANFLHHRAHIRFVLSGFQIEFRYWMGGSKVSVVQSYQFSLTGATNVCHECRFLIAGLRVAQCHTLTFTTPLKIKSSLTEIFLVILLLKVSIRPVDGMSIFHSCRRSSENC